MIRLFVNMLSIKRKKSSNLFRTTSAKTRLQRGALGVFLFFCFGTQSAFATYHPPVKPKHAELHQRRFKAHPILAHHTIQHASKSLYTHHTQPTLAFTPIPTFGLQHQQTLVCDAAVAKIGTPYVWGGTTPGGFDCSGFSQYVYKQDGIIIPRTAAEQFASLTPVKQIEPGDLVFFSLDGNRTVSHVGIYLGGNEFIHAPGRGQSIQIDDLNTAYWKAHYAGARRVIALNNPPASRINSTRTIYRSYGITRRS